MSTGKLYDIIIVGAGPVGLSLGISLAIKGKKLLVLEKDASTAEHSRAPAIWPKTQEILAELGQVHHFIRAAIEVPVMEIFDADRKKELLKIPIKELSKQTPFPQLLLLPQSKTEKLLLKRLQQFPAANIIFSAKVTKVIEEENSVTVATWQDDGEKQYTAKFVIGADGAQSTVREQMGIDFPGTTYPFKAALADIRFSEDQKLAFPRISTKYFPAIGIRISKDLWRIIMPFSERDNLDLEERVQRSVNNLFPPQEWDLVWKSEFKLFRRLASTFAKGRVVLAGDAAHLNSPVGGQGMNAGIQDVPPLTGALMEALSKDTQIPLKTFSDKRKKEIEKGVNKFTDILTRLLLNSNGKMIKPIFRILNYMLFIAPLRRKFLIKLAMLS